MLTCIQVYEAIEDAVKTASKMHPFVHNANYDADACPDICDPEGTLREP
jgi:hypothetical protein